MNHYKLLTIELNPDIVVYSLTIITIRKEGLEMEKKITFNGSFKDGGLYATTVFVAKDDKKSKQTQIGVIVDKFVETFRNLDVAFNSTERKISGQTLGNRAIIYITYIPDHFMLSGYFYNDDGGKWNDRVKKDAENLIAQIELSLSHIE